MIQTAMQATELEPQSMEDRILRIVNERATLTLDQLVEHMSASNWAPAFLAVDRLSRSGHIRLRRTKNREYEISRRYGHALGLPRSESRGHRHWTRPHTKRAGRTHTDTRYGTASV